jgi:hypothetical protein
LESEASGQFVSDELIIGRALQRQESSQELLDLGGPRQTMVATGEVEGKGVRALQPGGPQTEEMRPADVQELSGRIRVEVAAVKSGERLVEEREGKTFGELMFFK